MGDMSRSGWGEDEIAMSVENGKSMTQDVPATASPVLDAREILAVVERHQSRQRAICRDLEAVADSLPLDVDPSLCMRLARTLSPTLRAAHEYKEVHFSPLVRRVLADLSNVDAVLERLRAEYCETELLAEEIAEELSQWGICADHKSAEAMGYMLRGFFINLARHVDFECVILVEPIKTRLSRLEGVEYPEP